MGHIAQLLAELRQRRADLAARIAAQEAPQVAAENKSLQEFDRHLTGVRKFLNAAPRHSFFNDRIRFRFVLRKWRRQWYGEFRFKSQRRAFNDSANACLAALEKSSRAIRRASNQRRTNYENQYAERKNKIAEAFSRAHAVHNEFSGYFRNEVRRQGFFANIQKDEMHFWKWPLVIVVFLFIVVGAMYLIGWRENGAAFLGFISWAWMGSVGMLVARWGSAKTLRYLWESNDRRIRSKIKNKYTPAQIRAKAGEIRAGLHNISTKLS
jgi:hypothetical protein